MAQRQWRSDDTSKWLLSFGGGGVSAKTYSTNHTLDSGDGFYNSTLTGSASETTATVTLSDATYNLPCIIHQSAGTGVGNWEINFLTSVSSGTATFQFPLINSYTTGAQVATANSYSSITVNSGVTLTAPAWNGSKGGILPLFCNGTITVSGTISMSGLGYRGGIQNGANGNGNQGEGTGGTGSASVSANGSGGGGGDGGGNTGTGPGNSAAGGGHANAASNGPIHFEFSQDGGPAAPGGQAIGVAGLTTLFFGGGGGGGGRDGGNVSPVGVGGAGGGIIAIFGRTVTVTGSVVSAGANGVAHPNNHNGAGGGGAGGSILVKGHFLTLGTNLTTVPAGSGAWGCAQQHGNLASNGSVGRIHADYLTTFSGSSSPTIDTRQDFSLADNGGAFLFNMI